MQTSTLFRLPKSKRTKFARNIRKSDGIFPTLPIRTRLTLWYVSLLALLLLGFSGALYFLVARTLYQQVDDTLMRSAGQISFQPAAVSGQPPAFTVSTFVVDPATVSVVRAGDVQGTQLLTDSVSAGFVARPMAIWLRSAPPGVLPVSDNVMFRTVDNAGASFRVYSVGGQIGEGSMQVVSSLSTVESTLQQLALALALVVPTTLGAAAFGGMWFARRALAPVDNITRAAQQLSAHDLHQRLELNLPNDEVGRLARTFDDMLARLEHAFQREREFTSNASHELRTPLTVLRGEIQVALQHERSPQEYARVLQTLDKDVAQMSDTVNELLLLARADATRLETERETLHAGVLLETVCALWTKRAQEKEITLHVTAPDNLQLAGNEAYLLRALGNLVENAIKFSPPKTEITLTATRAQDAIVLTVQDHGAGVPAAQLPHILERFYRADDGRAPGNGLGLPLAQALLAAQGGRLTITSEEGVGTTAIVRIKVGG